MISDLLFLSSRECPICEEDTVDYRLCSNCLEKLDFVCVEDFLLGWDFDYFYPIFYDKAGKDLIKAFKFQNQANLARPLARIMVETAEERAFFKGIDLITYTPLHSYRQRQRGYNQAQLLAQEIGKLTGIEVRGLFKKVRHTPEQNKIDIRKRDTNLKGSVSLQSEIPGDRTLLLVDDIYTTGATVRSMLEVCPAIGKGLFAMSGRKVVGL